MKWVIFRESTGGSRKAREYWCTYASGDRWNARPSHAKKFETEAAAIGHAEKTPGVGSYQVGEQK
jgi:hypothetical protein